MYACVLDSLRLLALEASSLLKRLSDGMVRPYVAFTSSHTYTFDIVYLDIKISYRSMCYALLYNVKRKELARALFTKHACLAYIARAWDLTRGC